MEKEKYFDQQNLLIALEKQQLLQGLNTTELKLLFNMLQFKTYETDEIIFNEHENSDQIYFLLNGEVEVLKTGEEQHKNFSIAKLGPTMAFGEMAFIDNVPRSSTIRTRKKSLVGILNPSSLQNDSKEIQNINRIILGNITKLNVDRLRVTGQNYVKTLEEKIKEVSLRNEFGRFFIIVILIFGIGNGINEYLRSHHGMDTTTWKFTWVYLILILLPILYFVAKHHYPLSIFGVTLKHWQAAVSQGAALSLILLSLSLGIYWLLVKEFNFPPPKYHSTLNYFFGFWMLPYFMHTYLQEFIARGVIQTCLQRFFDDQQGLKAIFFTSLLFAIFHLHINAMAALITFVASIVFGLMYNYQKTLLGVSLLHWTLGLVGIYLGFL